MKTLSARSTAALVLSALFLVPAAHSETPAPGLAEPSAAILELRRKFMDPSVNALTFHSIDSIFMTNPVKTSGRPSAFPRKEQPLDFSYNFKGQTYAAEDALERTFTNALIIIKDGTVVYERYRNFTNPQTRFLSMSVAKSMTSILFGIALHEGKIKSLDEQITAYVPELKGTGFDGVTIRNAIDMKTGIDRSDAEQLRPGTPGAAMREQVLVRNTQRVTDEALALTRKAPPGTVFEYSSINTVVLGWVLERATGQPVPAYMEQKLWKPLGTEADGFWIVDRPSPDAHTFTGLGFNASLRDYARVGMMMLDEGRANGTQIVPKSWVNESVAGAHVPIAPGAPRGYNHAWWTVPNSSAYMAIGLQGQYIFVDPATRTVIVKVSYFPLADREAGEESIAFMQAASQWSGSKGK